LRRGRFGFLKIAVVQRLRYFALQASAQGNEPAVELFKQLLVNARLIVKSFHVAEGDQLAEISIALGVHRQENQMVVVFLWAFIDTLPLEAAGRRDIDLATDDRLNAVAHRLAVKFNGAEHVAMVGHGHRRLSKRLDALEHFIDLVGAV
jgi:hypothetical protein